MKMNKKAKIAKYIKSSYTILFLLTISLVLSVSWNEPIERFYGNEDIIYNYNISNNVSNVKDNLIIGIDTSAEKKIEWDNGTATSNYSSLTSLPWILFNTTTLILNINVTKDNQSGKFTLPFQARDNETLAGVNTFLYFTVNATNDYPDFALNESYPKEVNESTIEYSFNVTGTDEEKQYPLIYNLSFNNCTHAAWSDKTDCNLSYNITRRDNATSTFNFTNMTDNEVGTYNLTICATDNVNATIPPAYRDSEYDTNKTTCKNTTLYVKRTLNVNVTNCTNSIIQENENLICQVIVKTNGQTDNLNASSVASFTTGSTPPLNSSWFFGINNSNATNFMQTYNINVTPQKTEIGNWSINFSVSDINTGERVYEPIYVYVNRTQNSNPEITITPITNNVTSIYRSTTINFPVYDNDLLIRDKINGFNETINFQVTIYNNSITRENITGLSYVFLKTPVQFTNRTEANITFTANASQYGNYTLNITITDRGINGVNGTDSKEYNFTILSKNYPVWNQTNYTFNLTVNSTYSTTERITINLSQYVADLDNSTMTFTNLTTFPSFNMDTGGIVNFTPYKQDVGYQSITVTATNGFLDNTTTIFFNITNINSAPNITELFGNGINQSAIYQGTTINTNESQVVNLYLVINDNDLPINDIYYNETIQINTSTINSSGITTNLFEFRTWSDCNEYAPCNFSNQTGFTANFTPTKAQVGTYNISINIKDLNNESVQRNFTLIIQAINNPPNISTLTNRTSTINRSFYYRINATDTEDGNSTSNGNLTFSYNFSEGIDFFNSTIFNTTTGEINITFNETQGGKYKINITVTDSGIGGSGNLSDSEIFWIYVYDLPNITLPNLGETFNTSENSTYNFTFAINHSVADSLNYSFSLNSLNINSSLNICNGTNKTFYFTPNFTQESYGNYSNLTLFVFNSEYPELNTTRTWDFNITHTNYPINNYTDIQNQSNGSTVTLNLKNYFRDYDAEDSNINQKITFNYTRINQTSGAVPEISISNWINGSTPNITFSSTSSSAGLYSITAYEYNESNTSQVIRNITSNNFSVSLSVETVVVPTPVTSSGGGGGGGASTVDTIKLLAASETTINNNGHIEFKFEVINTGKSTLNNITLSNLIQQEISQEINTTFSKKSISSLSPGSSEKISLFIDIDTKKEGKYTLLLYANVSIPKISDWTEVYLNIIKANESEAEKMIIFTEKLIIENPECIELDEVFKEAKKLFEEKEYEKSIEKTESIVTSCKNAISRNSQIKVSSILDKNYANYLFFIIIILVFFLFYFIYQRARFKNKYSI